MSQKNLVIFKFGGSVLVDVIGFRKMSEIISEKPHLPLLLVVSAIADSTRCLHNAAIIAEKGDFVTSSSIISGLVRKHLSIAGELIANKGVFSDFEYEFNAGTASLNNWLKGVFITRELTKRTLDSILSCGEFFSLRLVFYFLKSLGMKVKMVDSAEIIVTDSEFGSANPDYDATRRNVETLLAPSFENNNIVITQGFVAADNLGNITTMGMESSNLTAALLADMLGVSEIVYWTDVGGIRTSDPKLFDVTENIPYMGFDCATVLAMNGLKLIHTEMISSARKNNTKLIYKSALVPEGESTVIHSEKSDSGFLILLNRGNAVLLSKKKTVYKRDDILPGNDSSIAWLRRHVLIEYSSEDYDYYILPTRYISDVIDAALENRGNFILFNLIAKKPNSFNDVIEAIKNLEYENSLFFLEKSGDIEIARILIPAGDASAFIEKYYNPHR